MTTATNQTSTQGTRFASTPCSLGDDAPTPIDDQASAIAWLIDNRRPDVAHEQAIRTLRMALACDTKALRILDGLAVN